MATLRIGDVVVTAGGHTGKVYSVKRDGSVHVRVATGAHAGQIRRFRATTLRRI